jgi:hypothetical protein
MMVAVRVSQIIVCSATHAAFELDPAPEMVGAPGVGMGSHRFRNGLRTWLTAPTDPFEATALTNTASSSRVATIASKAELRKRFSLSEDQIISALPSPVVRMQASPY